MRLVKLKFSVHHRGILILSVFQRYSGVKEIYTTIDLWKMSDRNMGDPSLSSHTLEKVKKAKVTIETFYSNLVNQHIEREGRMQALERSMNNEGVSDEQVSFLGVV